MLIAIKRKLDWCQNRTRANNINKDKEGCFIFVKGPFHLQDITVLSVYASNNKPST